MKRARATEADISRAIRAASKAALPHAIEVMPDGTIRIVPVESKDSGDRRRNFVDTDAETIGDDEFDRRLTGIIKGGKRAREIL